VAVDDVVVGGASGLIGSALVATAAAAGEAGPRLGPARWSAGPDTIAWDRQRGGSTRALEGAGPGHLAGKAVGPHRWTETHKTEVLESRTRSTSLLAKTMAALQNRRRSWSMPRPPLLRGPRRRDPDRGRTPGNASWPACASLGGGDRTGFQAGIRVAMLRTGIVLSPPARPRSDAAHLQARTRGKIGSGTHVVELDRPRGRRSAPSSTWSITTRHRAVHLAARIR